MRIFKYRMPAPGAIENIEMPEGARIVHVALQQGFITAWALVNPDARTQRVSFTTVGTGWEVPEGTEHVGTAVLDQFVWHVLRAL